MKLRKYREEDAEIVASWVESETVLYQWSAHWISEYPVSGEKLNAVLREMQQSVRLVPLIFCDEDDRPQGFLFIRFTDEALRKVRFGFVIVDPAARGTGRGKAMLLLAEQYAFETLAASEISLGVFENNPKARYAYRAAGFTETGEKETAELKIGRWNVIEMAIGRK